MISQISFLGRREVVYNLESAAKQATKLAELNAKTKGPRPLQLNGADIESKAAMRAYLDAAVYDNFSYTLINYPKGIEHNKQTLANILTKNGDSSPLKIFEEELLFAVNKHNKNGLLLEIKSFIADIASRIKY